jgi:microcystin-dependent protein
MSEPYIGEIRLFGGNFAPLNWAFCNGQTMPIAQNEPLFTLIGTTYGGDGQTTFNLPNLGARMPLGTSGNHPIGMSAGEQSVTLTTGQLPAHTHPAQASDNAATLTSPAQNVWANWGDGQYTTNSASVAMDAAGTGTAGNGLAHENRAPYLGLSFIIALEGIFPSQN